jgi:hypothetical protein
MGGCRRQGTFSANTGRPLIMVNSKGDDYLNQDQNTNVNELNSERETEGLVKEPLCQESDTPLFLRNSSEGKKCDAQDEKDKTGE